MIGRAGAARGELVVLLAAFAALAGCARTMSYDATRFAAWRIAADRKLDGRAAVLTTPEDDTTEWARKPSGAVGSAGTVRVPVGVIAREAARRVLGELFLDGAEALHEAAGLERYRAVVTPRITAFEYHFPLSAMFTSRVELALSLHVIARDARGEVLLDRTYDSGRIQADGAGRDDAAAALDRGVHQVAQALMLRAAADVREHLAPAAAASAP
jgi:hypothetical protein